MPEESAKKQEESIDKPEEFAGTREQDIQPDALAEKLHEQAMELLRRLPAFGPVIMLYLQSAHRRFQFISDLEWLLIPPLMNRQCKLFMKKSYPFAFVSWAFLNEEAENRLVLNGGKLRPQDWKSGENLWLVDIVAPFGGADKVLADLQQNEFPGKTIRILVPDPATGGVTKRELPSRPVPQEDVQPSTTGDA